MALRDQPYLPLYIQDIMTDEKLNECCAATHGVYIKGVMCLMHKSAIYGKILLKQKYKQTSSKEQNFALMLAKHLPYTVDVIFAALTELIQEDVCQFEGDYLVQKRMFNDGILSEKRSLSGSRGGSNTQKNNKLFALAKIQATTEYEIENEIECISFERYKENFSFELTEYQFMLIQEMMKIWMKYFNSYSYDIEIDFPFCLQIAYLIAKDKKWQKASVVNGKLNDCLFEWEKIVKFIHIDNFYSSFNVERVSKNFQGIKSKMYGTGINKGELGKATTNFKPFTVDSSKSEEPL